MNTPLIVATIVGVALLLTCVWLGVKFPLVFTSVKSQGQVIWTWILLLYIFVASVTPVWILLQPRDYLNSFLLYLVLLGAFIGIFFTNPPVELPAFSSFIDRETETKLGLLFPFLFVTVACGAISGFHSLVASGTTAKQLDREPHARPVGYGGMLIEGLLAVIALITVVSLSKSDYLTKLGTETPIKLFSSGVGTFVEKLGIPENVGITFAALAISAFALTSLDTATRLGRFAFQEFFKSDNQTPVQNFLTNRFIATFCTVLPGGILALSGSYLTIWPIFGSANQLLAALALLAGSIWLAKKGQKNEFLRYPMYFMFAVTLSALAISVYQKIKLIVDYYTKQEMPEAFSLLSTYILAIIAILLFVVAIILVREAYQKLKTSNAKE